MDPALKQFALSRSPLLFPTAWPTDYLGAVFAEVASSCDCGEPLCWTAALDLDRRHRRRRRRHRRAIALRRHSFAAARHSGAALAHGLADGGARLRRARLLRARSLAARAQGRISFSRFLRLPGFRMTRRCRPGSLPPTALGLHFFQHRLPAFNWTVAALVWAYAVIVALILNFHYFTGYAGFLHHMPSDAPRGMAYFWGRRYVAFPILGLLLCVVFSRKAAPVFAAGTFVTALLLAALCIRFWDGRAPFQRLIDSAKHPPELMALIDSRPGEILWVDGLTEAWYLAGRPQWASAAAGRQHHLLRRACAAIS